VRRSELLGLALADVDLDNRTMRVVGGKGNKDRLVPLTQAAADALRDYLGVRRARPATPSSSGEAGRA